MVSEMRKEFSIFKGLSIYYVTLDITILHWGRVFPIDYNIAGGTQNLYYVIYGQHLNSLMIRCLKDRFPASLAFGRTMVV